MKKSILLLFAALVVLSVIAACGSGNNSGAETDNESVPASSSEGITFTATDYEFDQKEYRVKKGETVTLTLDNKKGNHGMKIEALGVNLDSKNPSQEVTFADAGTYEIECSVPCGSGHITMKSTLIVE